MTRTEWIVYMLGYMASKDWRISQEDAEDFKAAFPEVPAEFIDRVTKAQ